MTYFISFIKRILPTCAVFQTSLYLKNSIMNVMTILSIFFNQNYFLG